MSVWTAVCFAGTWGMFRQDLVAAHRRVASSATVLVSTDVAVSMSDIVAVLFVEGVVRYQFEGLSPEE